MTLEQSTDKLTWQLAVEENERLFEQKNIA